MRVRLSNITKTFDDVTALRDLSFDAQDGEFLVLLGPSGCGKTTALRIIAGLERPDSGTLYLDNEVANHLCVRERKIAMVFQNLALYPHRTVLGNIAYPLRLQRQPKAAIERSAKEVAELLSIEHLLNRFPRQLSAGEAQRVALARAMVRRPRCFLFDEPFSNLDAQLRVRMRAELREIHEQRPTTTIHVTHDQEEASVLADRIVVLNEGYVIQSGAPHEIYSRPCCRFVAGFVGSPQMNFVRGLLRAQGAHSILEILGQSLRIPLSRSTLAAEQLPVVAGIRPEDLQIAPVTADVQFSEKSIQLVGIVRLFQAAEPEVYVHVDAHGQRMVVRCDRKRHFKPGNTCIISAHLDIIHVFDAETGSRMAQESERGGVCRE